MSNLEVHFFSSQNNNFQDTGCDDVIVSRLLGPAYSLSVTDTVINWLRAEGIGESCKPGKAGTHNETFLIA